MSQVDQAGIRAIADWLIHGARSAARAEDVLAELCPRLVDCGVPLWRTAVFVRTPHPEIMGRRFIWLPGEAVKALTAPFETLESADFRASPMAKIYATGIPIRRRLVDSGCPIDFPILQELQVENVTDYLASPLIFSDGAVHAATWTTRQASGFAEVEIEAIESIVPHLARVAEIRALRRTSANILDTYVGRQAGARILAGQIRRGHSEAIDAAIWLSDMRGFTALADRLPAAELLAVLNRYFDCQVPVILDHGGEVLKFMGDGLLAIFPVADGGEGEAAICRTALAAAREARALVAALGASGELAAVPSLRFGLALHVGNVLYGNIGGGNRLDFTCIGPAVNLAARLEKLASKLGREIIASAAFTRHCGADLVPIGEFALPGFSQPQMAFGLAGESSVPGPAATA
jgi:adenylate cyclase